MVPLTIKLEYMQSAQQQETPNFGVVVHGLVQVCQTKQQVIHLWRLVQGQYPMVTE